MCQSLYCCIMSMPHPPFKFKLKFFTSTASSSLTSSLELLEFCMTNLDFLFCCCFCCKNEVFFRDFFNGVSFSSSMTSSCGADLFFNNEPGRCSISESEDSDVKERRSSHQSEKIVRLWLNVGAFIRKATNKGKGGKLATYWTYNGSFTTPG